MIEEFMNTPYEVHAFMIGFVIAFIGFYLTLIIVLLKEKDKRQEVALVIGIMIVIIVLIMAIPKWVMINNFYKEIHYGLGGILVGFITGFILPYITYRLLRKRLYKYFGVDK